MSLDTAWQAVIDAVANENPESPTPARPTLLLAGDDYEARVQLPDGTWAEAAAPTAVLALEALANDIDGSDPDSQARVRHEMAQRKRDEAQAALDKAQADLDATPEPPVRPS